MRPISPIYFAGSPHSSRSVTPEPASRPHTPESVHPDASADESIQQANQIAKNLLQHGKITQDEYNGLHGGLDHAQRKTNQAREWQKRAKYLGQELDQVRDELDVAWNDLDKVIDDRDQVEDQLTAVQQKLVTDQQASNARLGMVKGAYYRVLNQLNQYKHNNEGLVRANVWLNHALRQSSSDKTETQQAVPGSSSRAKDSSPLRRILLDANMQRAKAKKEEEIMAAAKKAVESAD